MQKMWAGNKLPKRFFVHGKNTSYLAGCAGTGIGDAYCCRIMVIPTLLNQSADDSNKLEAKMYTQYLLDDGYNLNPVTYNNPIP